MTEGTVTVLFTDVAGSTELRARLGDKAAHQILSDIDELVRAQITADTGRTIKGTGDGVMAAFASARRAVACAATIQRALQEQYHHRDDKAAVRIGINSGEVSEEGGDLFGAAVNAAARVAAKARGGEILVSSVVKQLAGRVPDVTFADRGRFRLKGFEERWQLFEVVWKSQAEAIVPALVERTKVVGRDAERNEILGYLAAAAKGHGGVVMIAGEPGIGKTRLAEEIQGEARKRGFRALTGHCVEIEGTAPYMPFVEILEAAIKEVDSKLLRDALGESAPEVARVLPRLRRIFPDIPPPLELPPEQERRYLFNSIYEFFARAATNRPQIYVLDDLHWGDEATLLLLQHLAERVQDIRLLILATYREAELAGGRPLARTLEDFVRRRLAHRVRLKRLPAEAVREMLTALARGQDPPDQLVEVINRETEGNPFFLEEVFQHLNEAGQLFDSDGRWKENLTIPEADVPSGARLVIDRRLERLSENSRAVLATAAVIGRSFDYRLLRAASDVDPDAVLDAVDIAERAQLIVATSEGAEASFAFAHELIRQTLLVGLSLPRRQRLHVRVADAMEQVFGEQAPEHAAELAHHLYMAGDSSDAARAARYLSLAGDRATDAAAYEDALRTYENALRLQPEDDRQGRAELLSRVGLTQMALGRWDTAAGILDHAVDEFEALGEGTAAGGLCARMAILLTWSGRFQEGLEIAGRGLTAIGGERTAVRTYLLCTCGSAIGAAGGHDLATAMLHEGMQVAAELREPAALAYATSATAIHNMMYGRFREGNVVGTQARERNHAAGFLWENAGLMSFLEWAAPHMGWFPEALELHREVSPRAKRLGHVGAQFLDLRATIAMHLADGDLDAADIDAQQEMVVCRAGGVHFARDSCAIQAGVAFARGDWEAAANLSRQAEEWELPWVGAPTLVAARLMYAAYAGYRDEARNLLEHLREDMPVPGAPNGWGSWNVPLFAVEGLVAMGEMKLAAEMLPLVEATITDVGWVARSWDARSTRLIAAIAAASGGMWDRAEEHFQLARVDAQRLGRRCVADCDYFEGWALFQRGQDGDRERSRPMAVAAVEGYRGIGMPRHVELAEKLATQ